MLWKQIKKDGESKIEWIEKARLNGLRKQD